MHSESNHKQQHQQQQNLVWFSKHPVVSTVLWLLKLGTGVADDEMQKEPSVSRLSWKDEHGGNIADFIDDGNFAEDASDSKNLKVSDDEKKASSNNNVYSSCCFCSRN